VAALAGVADYLEAIAALAPPEIEGADPFRRAHNAMRAQEIALTAPLLDYLRGRNDVRLIGPADPTLRAPTISLALREPAATVARRLATQGIMAGGGHFYGYRTLQGLGIEPAHGVVRLSFLHYTTRAEIDRLIAALDAEL
jgi:selenocysteine lyase/cysteine desulfurase